MHTDNTIDSDWYTTAFDALYPVVYAHRTVETAAPEARFAVEKLGLTRRDTVLDLCCGTGRHIVHLRESCGAVYGLDFSRELLGVGALHYGLAQELVRGDMRYLPFAERFDAVCNFFTSFGYFVEAADNRAVLQEVARVLKPGGRFMLDYFNTEHLLRTLEPASEREVDGMRILEKRWIDHDAMRVNKNTTVLRDGAQVFQTTESVQLYTQDELCGMLRAAGLQPESFYGDFSGAPLDASQARLIVTGRKG